MTVGCNRVLSPYHSSTDPGHKHEHHSDKLDSPCRIPKLCRNKRNKNNEEGSSDEILIINLRFFSVCNTFVCLKVLIEFCCCFLNMHFT